ncbi:IS1634 family transposase [Soehngenia longivitae]|uniref:IS1634 family transposase n=2 Tax=Soehngenia longivitae TaxID=2562294 RepID=A0A4Z0D350_9FIRM|nr:IS1634 family transposase [Soehngenia longivitae]
MRYICYNNIYIGGAVMASIQVYNSRGNRYVRIIESYREPGMKYPRIRVLKNLGREDELEAKEPGIVERLKKELEESKSLEDTIKKESLINELKNIISENSSNNSKGFPIINYGVKVYESLWKELRLDYFFDYRQNKDSKIEYSLKDVVSLLTYSRLLNPDSKKSTYESRNSYINSKDLELEHLYRGLKFLGIQKDNLEKHINKQLAKTMDRNLNVAFYDVTTYYFESVDADDLRKFGYSKDNKVNQVQVVMGLLIDDQGIPISYELFPGNTNDFKTLVPVIEKLKKTYGIKKIIITADRGLNSKQNLAYLKSEGYDYVMAYKIRSSSRAVKEMVLGDDYKEESSEFKWKLCKFENTVSYQGEKVKLEDNMLITWSLKRAQKDRKDRERLIEKSKKLVESPSALKAEMKKGGKKYVQLSLAIEEPLRFNEKQKEIDEKFDGYYGIQFSDKSLSPEKVLDIYNGLWKIEESFKVLKSNLEARPIYVWTESSIKGHFVMCYLALVLERYLEYKLRQKGIDLSTEKIQEAIESAKIMVVEKESNGLKYYIKSETKDDYDKIVKALGIKEIPSTGLIKNII